MITANLNVFRLTALADRLGASHRPLVVALAIFASLHLAWLVYRLPVPLEIFSNEAWNAWHAAAAMGARSLYPRVDELIINNYPPLSYYVVGFLGERIGDVVVAGRILSLLATVAIGGLIAVIVRHLGGTRGAAAIGAVWWLASMFRSASDYVGANDPTLLALAIMLAGFVWFLVAMDAQRSVLPGIAVMVVAGFFKHNLIVLPVLALLWYARANVAGAVRAAVFGGSLAIAGLVVCHVAFGPDFITQLTLPREVRWLRPLQHVNRLQFLIVAFAVWLLWVVNDWRNPAARLTAWWIGLGLASYFLQKLAPGVAINAQFEVWCGMAVGFGCAMTHLARVPAVAAFGVARARAAILALVLIRLLADFNIEPYRLLSASYRAGIDARVAHLQREIAAVRTGPTPIGCSVMTVCLRAGQPFVFDNFGAGMRVAAGHMSRARFDEAIRTTGLMYRISDAKVSWERNKRELPPVDVTVPFKR